MKCLISLFLVITIPIFGVIYPVNSQFGPGGQDQYTNLRRYSDGFSDPSGPSNFGQGYGGYEPQFRGYSADPSGINGGPYNGGGYSDMSNLGYGPFGPESTGPWPPGITGLEGFPVSGGSGYGHRKRHGRHGDDPSYDSGYGSSVGRRRRRRPGGHGLRDHQVGNDQHGRGPTEGNKSTYGRRGRKNKGHRRRRSRSSSEESSASSGSSGEEDTGRRRGRQRNNGYGYPSLGWTNILDPMTHLQNGRELFQRTIDAGKDLAHESGNQISKMAQRVSGGFKQHSDGITQEGANGARTQVNSITDFTGNITGAAGRNGTAITIGSFKNPKFIKEFLYNIYRTMSQWGQVLQTLPGNLWRNFQRMMECIGGRITGNKCSG